MPAAFSFCYYSLYFVISTEGRNLLMKQTEIQISTIVDVVSSNLKPLKILLDCHMLRLPVVYPVRIYPSLQANSQVGLSVGVGCSQWEEGYIFSSSGDQYLYPAGIGPGKRR